MLLTTTPANVVSYDLRAPLAIAIDMDLAGVGHEARPGPAHE